MPKSLTKVQKLVAKKKGRNAALHEGSRDARMLQRASARDERILKLAASREKQNRPLLERIAYFSHAVEERTEPRTIAEIQNMIQKFIHHDDEDMAKLKAERRPGRPPTAREELMKRKREEHEKEYASGFWVPDLEDEKNVVALRDWEGEWVSLNRIKFVRIAKDDYRQVATHSNARGLFHECEDSQPWAGRLLDSFRIGKGPATHFGEDDNYGEGKIVTRSIRRNNKGPAWKAVKKMVLGRPVGGMQALEWRWIEKGVD